MHSTALGARAGQIVMGLGDGWCGGMYSCTAGAAEACKGTCKSMHIFARK